MKQSHFVQYLVSGIRALMLTSLFFFQFGMALPAVFAEEARYGGMYANLTGHTVDVNVDDHWVTARGWPSGALLTMTISGSVTYSSPGPIEVPAEQTPVTFEFGSELPHLQAGDIVTVTDGTTTVAYAISNLQVTEMDVQADTISGIAPQGSLVKIWTAPGSRPGFVPRTVTADGAGTWLANFHDPGINPDETGTVDLQSGDSGQAAQRDGVTGNATWIDWQVPDPRIEANIPSGNQWLQAMEWLVGTELTLAVDNPFNGAGIDYTGFAAAERREPGSAAFDTRADFAWPVIGLQPGFILIVTGNDISKTLVIPDTQVTSMDAANDRLTGITTPDLRILVSVNDPSQTKVQTQSDSQGNWSADFAGKVDFQPGPNGSTEVFDEDGDMTRVDWSMQNPHSPRIFAIANSNMVWARGWPNGTVVTMTISGSSGETYTATMAPPLQGPGEARGRFDLQGYSVQVGDVITVLGNEITKTLRVSTPNVTDLDLEADIISGTGTPGAQIQVCIDIADGCIARWVIPDSSGIWTANYHDPGTGNDDPGTLDLQPGSTGGMSEYEEDFDRTNSDLQIPYGPTPGVIEAPITPIQINTAINTSASFTGLEMFAPHTAVWDWGDGNSSDGAVTETDGSGSVTGSHTYTSSGVYTISVTVTDEAGSAGTSTYEYVVIYDPTAGFVTGGGWIDSPVNEDYPYMQVEGRAVFGFVSKYKKGATVPEGSTEFQFKAGELNFRSTSYHWLVVNQAGANAQFKGYGTINGAGNYGFMIWAGDSSPDTFLIKIWDAETEAVVYDNGTDQAIGGGSIVVHKK